MAVGSVTRSPRRPPGVGSPVHLRACRPAIIVWAVTGPLFQFSDTWQLVINTGTTIVTFLMVFLIQNTQNRDSVAMQIKLDELLRAVARVRIEDGEGATEAASCDAVGGGARPSWWTRRRPAARGRADRTRPREEGRAGSGKARDEGLDGLRVELGAGDPAQLLHGGVRRTRIAVGPLGRHRVERVGDRHDARLDRDLLAPKAVGNPRPSSRSWWERTIRSTSGDSCASGSSMRSPSAGCSLIWRNSSAVSSPGLCRTDSRVPIFPMSCSSPPSRMPSRLVPHEAEALGGGHGVLADADRVASGVGVLGLERARQHLDALEEELLDALRLLPAPGARGSPGRTDSGGSARASPARGKRAPGARSPRSA